MNIIRRYLNRKILIDTDTDYTVEEMTHHLQNDGFKILDITETPKDVFPFRRTMLVEGKSSKLKWVPGVGVWQYT